jgi:hypothetical protein
MSSGFGLDLSESSSFHDLKHETEHEGGTQEQMH